MARNPDLARRRQVVGIQARIGDAKLLWRSGHLEGAFLVVRVAVAAAARLSYPNSRDREAFELFVRDAYPGRLSVEFRGECHPVEHILYKWLRCSLVHEATVPFDIEFMPDVGVCAEAVSQLVWAPRSHC